MSGEDIAAVIKENKKNQKQKQMIMRLTCRRGDSWGKMNSLQISHDKSRILPYTKILNQVSSLTAHDTSHINQSVPLSSMISQSEMNVFINEDFQILICFILSQVD